MVLDVIVDNSLQRIQEMHLRDLKISLVDKLPLVVFVMEEESTTTTAVRIRH
jgi:hypothetical protein